MGLVAKSVEPSTWIYRENISDGNAFSLFCFPYAGGGASPFLRWRRFFPADVELLPVQLPGRENRSAEAPVTDPGELMPLLHEGLKPYLSDHMAFWGHSMGGLIACRFAAYLLEHREHAPVHVFLTGTPPPGAAVPHQTMEELLDLAQGIPDAVRNAPELMEHFMSIAASDYRLLGRICREITPLNVPATVLSGSEDLLAPAEKMRLWENFFAGGCSFGTFPGGHFFPREHREQIASLFAETIFFHQIQ